MRMTRVTASRRALASLAALLIPLASRGLSPRPAGSVLPAGPSGPGGATTTSLAAATTAAPAATTAAPAATTAAPAATTAAAAAAAAAKPNIVLILTEARQHLHLLYIGQRVPSRRAPSHAWQADALRG